MVCDFFIIYGREHRLGIDLVHDDVERQLLKEIQTIEGVLIILKKSLEQTTEQIRRIKAQFYALDRDLADKENAIKLDYVNSGLKLINLEYDNLNGMNSDRASLNARLVINIIAIKIYVHCSNTCSLLSIRKGKVSH